MLRLRLQRRGKKNYATYRVVVADQHAPVKGKFLVDVGHYNPHSNTFVVNKEVVTQWLAKGAQPTSTVHNLLVTNNILSAPKKTSWRPKKKEVDPSEAQAAAEKKAEKATEVK